MNEIPTTPKRKGRPFLTTRAHPELVDLVRAEADRLGVDVSDVLRRAIALHVASEEPDEVLFKLST